MRDLTENEFAVVHDKLSKFIGEENIEKLINREDDKYVFKYHNKKLLYIREKIANQAVTFDRKEILFCGVCFGKFTSKEHKMQFKLSITSLDYLSVYCKHKVWVKDGAEDLFTRGNHVRKMDLSKMSDEVPQYAGVVVYNLKDLPLGFGAAAKSTLQCRTADPGANVVFNYGDIGEYIRNEDALL